MLMFLLAGQYRVTEFWEEGFVWPRLGEISVSLTGHLEEMFIGKSAKGEPIFEIREVGRFRLVRRDPMMPYRIVCRNKKRTGAVREIAWNSGRASLRCWKLSANS